uniref:Protein furry C-terminal domain-containing protein n=1 Tax=Ciona savignyi TaxID=51511 RepID=H2Y5Z6_CIOSA
MLDDLPKQLEPPFCSATPNTITPVVEQLKLEIFKINDTIEGYRNEVYTAYKCLDIVNSILREVTTSTEELEYQQLTLCQLLYKLHFQLLLIFQNFCKLIRIVTTSSPENQDISKIIGTVFEELRDNDDNGHYDVEEELRSMTIDEATTALHNSILGNNYQLARVQLVVLRKLWLTRPFGLISDSVANFLANQYLLLNHREKCYAVLGRNDIVQSTNVCNKLMDVNLQIQTSLKLLDSKPPDHDVTTNNETPF